MRLRPDAASGRRVTSTVLFHLLIFWSFKKEPSEVNTPPVTCQTAVFMPCCGSGKLLGGANETVLSLVSKFCVAEDVNFQTILRAEKKKGNT